MLRIIFPLGNMANVGKLSAFLGQRLNKAYGFGVKGGEVVIDRGLRNIDEAWKVALFVKNQSGMWLRFVIEGRDESGSLTYLSTCQKCRQKANTPHSQHVVEGEHDGRGSGSSLAG